MRKGSGDNASDFAARAVELKAMAQEHRQRAETTSDEAWRTIHHAAAESYDNLASDMEKLVARLASIDRAIARAEAKISACPHTNLDRE